ncbi:serine/threonine-protein phosphatase with EF-hands 1 [Rhinatrema bivittatum]|uniref:serine/threonine-protein phosphatase with EF-hands 1 n=1 Tax=Rhinatrema bivittatum TaxID=194408 RepID=UPI0011287C58|nr:serine/threonine-protein phosphatase with EF-hands 1 [Rhinatrema bivittatum]XP_029459202.1 serine/threonine-protein phosphatase with EF-hands 1 [Rhinatrema bivittatum]XP_029459203.1 serine/threonine-protein phosphatase with EF-hands 1 [Rhinatrema bivittatum]XP_029459204.1 serine/threonine-protein phosphatase with EF-hands 1 [Rhinatrema bivittatum]XP_029459205.1 serine/threonine-protein phosphatase with EF-hands 1 [Rhinatrema bivittatum]XP_029459206.1 serine/threonine-protein phosphatase wit
MGCGTSAGPGSQAKKSERAMKAAVLIQRWYRRYVARLEMRRRCTLSIFQSIEYAEEQAQLQLSTFFTFMLDHFTHLNGTGKDTISDLFSSLSECRKSSEDHLLEYSKVEVPHSYQGPRLSFPLTISDTNALLHAFKKQQLLHARYVLQLLHEAKKFLKQLPNIIHLSTSYAKELTICGDLHGKLDDLMLIFYKNGLPSAENPYLFNGDFVDRGKNSMEILIILLAFLLVYPNNFHLNRGNHEDHIINLRYGFTKEVMQKYKFHGRKILQLLQDIYSWLPLATIIDGKVLVLHGGIADTTDLDFLTHIKRNKFTSAMRPPRPSTESSHSSLGQKKESKPKVSHLAQGRHIPHTIPELTAVEQEEWKQVINILWSDPRKQNGCSPNIFRGGGCYFGPDVTSKLLKKYNLKMLIRSHECKHEGYELCHDGKVVTIFSASNYYEEGSNRGAYLKLRPDLVPRFVQYQVSKSTRKLTLHQRVSVAEESALRSLREKLYAHRSELLAAFRKYDQKQTGRISCAEWAVAVESVLHLDLPWRTLRSRLVRLASDGSVEYLSCFEDLKMEQPIKQVRPSLAETVYRYKTDLKIIFNIIDKDHSGLISIEEFRQTWKLFSSHLHIDIDDATIDDLARAIDTNKDGSIDFNEFLEAFRVVQKFESKESH